MTQEIDPLAALDGVYATTQSEVDDGTVKPLPDGVYLAKVDDASVGTSRSSNEVMFVLEFEVLAGPKKGRKTWKRHMLTKKGQPNADAIPRLKGDLDLLGMQLAKLSELRTRAKDLNGKVVLIKVSTPKEFTNVYIVRAVNDAGEVASLTQQHEAGLMSTGTAPAAAGGAQVGDMFAGGGAPVSAAGDVQF